MSTRRSRNSVVALAALAAFAMAGACAAPTNETGPPAPNRAVEVAGSIAEAAASAASRAAALEGASRQSIIDAALAAATEQAQLVAPTVLDPGWQRAISAAVALAITLAKDQEATPIVNEERAQSEVEKVVLHRLKS